MAKKRRKHRRKQRESHDDDWVEYGGELIWAVGYTAGGAPYGLTEEEYEEAMVEHEPSSGRARARQILERVFDPELGLAGGVVRLGKPAHLGEGREREAWCVDVNVSPDPDGHSGSHVVLLPKRWTEPGFDARVRREVAVLTRLSALELPFNIPRVVAVVAEEGWPVVVERWLPGMPLDQLARSQKRRRPWPIIAKLAQAVHCLDTVTAYCEAGAGTGSEVTPAQVRVQELGLVGRWYLESLDQDLGTEPPDEALNRLRGVLRRAEG